MNTLLSNRSISLPVLFFVAFATLCNATPQDNPTNSDNDKIYDSRELSKRAVIDQNRYDRNIPSAAGCSGHGIVIIRAVLRKSGHVTDIEVVEKGGCSTLEQKATKAVEAVKFKPAKKDGAIVSSRREFQFKYECDDLPNKRCT